MGKFIDYGEGFAFQDNEGYTIELNDENYWVWLHREEPFKDMAQVTDDRDGLNWYFFRYDHEEQFDDLDMIARKVGRVILGSHPVEGVEQVFENQHQVDTDEIENFLNGLSDEPRD